MDRRNGVRGKTSSGQSLYSFLKVKRKSLSASDTEIERRDRGRLGAPSEKEARCGCSCFARGHQTKLEKNTSNQGMEAGDRSKTAGVFFRTEAASPAPPRHRFRKAQTMFEVATCPPCPALALRIWPVGSSPSYFNPIPREASSPPQTIGTLHAICFPSPQPRLGLPQRGTDFNMEFLSPFKLRFAPCW